MNTDTAILVTQIPIAMGILWVSFELWKTRKELVNLLQKLTEREKK